MIRKLAVAIALCTLTFPALAQTPPPAAPAATPHSRPPGPDRATQKAAIARLGWMVGNWEGSGWIDTPSGRRSFRQTETVESRLSGDVIVVEGRGYAGTPEALMFNALAVISYDDTAGKYAFRSWTQGHFTNAEANVLNGPALRWSMTFPDASIRYTITQPEPGKWNEVGERTTDGGATWTQFFEMNLTKKP